MAEVAEVEAVLDSLVEAVVVAVDRHEQVVQDAEALPIGGFLWKFPSEGSNHVRTANPPPAPQLREYPRKCDQCGACWVSDREFELDHLRRCPISTNIDVQEDMKRGVARLGVARRVWCEVDGSFTRLQWRFDMELWSDGGACATNSIAFADITEVSTLDEPPYSFQIVTRDARTVVFQWRPENDDTEATSDLVPYRLKLDAHQWQEYLDELSKYARNCPWENPPSRSIEEPTEKSQSTAAVFKKLSLLLLSGSGAQDVLESSLCSIKTELGTECWSLCDDDGNSLVHLALSLSIGDRTPDIVSTLLGMGVECNQQNHEGESPLLLVAASGDLPTMQALLAAPSIQVDLPCALGVTAFHAAANAGDVEMLQLLCGAGAQPDLRDDNGWTALHYAAACSTGLEALHFLCELLTDGFIDAQCSEGNTALHVAAGCGCLDNARALLETAANPHVCNLSGENAYRLALRNNHIQCAVAINDYQSMPETSYTEIPSISVKESVISQATVVVPNGLLEEHSEWVECFTEDGYAYYYNSVTGESSWYKPGEYQPPEAWGNVENEGIFDDKTSENDTSYSYAPAADHDTGSILGDSAGHQLPLCLIPMVSPLTSLDNPTAATKYEAARRRARKQRKRRQSKLNLIQNPDVREDVAFEGTVSKIYPQRH